MTFFAVSMAGGGVVAPSLECARILILCEARGLLFGCYADIYIYIYIYRERERERERERRERERERGEREREREREREGGGGIRRW